MSEIDYLKGRVAQVFDSPSAERPRWTAQDAQAVANLLSTHRLYKTVLRNIARSFWNVGRETPISVEAYADQALTRFSDRPTRSEQSLEGAAVNGLTPVGQEADPAHG